MIRGQRCRVPLAAEGLVFVVPLAILALGCVLLGWWGTAALGALLTACVAAFFRDPERQVSSIPGAIVSPADGRIMDVVREVGGQRISIFLSILDVHINRAPYGGQVQTVIYTPGKFLAAYRQEASTVNESTSITIAHHGHTFVVKQIAGVLARRIVCRVKPGDVLEKGQRYGLIRFGSRTDLVLPPEAEVVADIGDSVRGGETVLAILKDLHDI